LYESKAFAAAGQGERGLAMDIALGVDAKRNWR
jgi:hypothetical protein